ncbi:DNA-invertase [Francisella sp. W12-1067]|nr:DNA-invertase [Francisella sp. W12-1067]
MLIGYIRFILGNTNSQKHLQFNALREYGVGKKDIYKDYVFGDEAKIEGLNKAMKRLQRGDTLVMWSLNNLAESYSQIIDIIKKLSERKIRCFFIKENFDTIVFVNSHSSYMFSWFAKLEQKLTQENLYLSSCAVRNKKFGNSYNPSINEFKLMNGELPNQVFGNFSLSPFLASRPKGTMKASMLGMARAHLPSNFTGTNKSVLGGGVGGLPPNQPPGGGDKKSGGTYSRVKKKTLRVVPFQTYRLRLIPGGPYTHFVDLPDLNSPHAENLLVEREYIIYDIQTEEPYFIGSFNLSQDRNSIRAIMDSFSYYHNGIGYIFDRVEESNDRTIFNVNYDSVSNPVIISCEKSRDWIDGPINDNDRFFEIPLMNMSRISYRISYLGATCVLDVEGLFGDGYIDEEENVDNFNLKEVDTFNLSHLFHNIRAIRFRALANYVVLECRHRYTGQWVNTGVRVPSISLPQVNRIFYF